MKLAKNNRATLNAVEFQSMLAHCRRRICEIVVELEDVAGEHEADPCSECPLEHIAWIEGHLLGALFPVEFRPAEERSAAEKLAIKLI